MSNNTSPKAAMETESIHISPISGNLSNINVFEDTAQNSLFMSKNSIYNETTLQEDDTTIIGGTPALLHDQCSHKNFKVGFFIPPVYEI